MVAGNGGPGLGDGFSRGVALGDLDDDNELDTTEVWGYFCLVDKVTIGSVNTVAVNTKLSNGDLVTAIDTASVIVDTQNIHLPLILK